MLVLLHLLASPVAYPLDRVPEDWRLLYSINPMAGIIGAFRSCLLNEPVLWDCLGISLAVSIVLLIVGVMYFRNVERRFADIV